MMIDGTDLAYLGFLAFSLAVLVAIVKEML